MPSGHIDLNDEHRPLTDHAWGVLRRLAETPLPRQHINAGVVDRFWREGLVTEEGREIHITAVGIAKLDDAP